MILCVRAAVVLAILAYWPNLLEQFEPPKAAVVRVLGCGLLAATLASVLVKSGGARRSTGRRSGPSGEPGDGVNRNAGRLERVRTPAEEHALRWQPLDVCMAAWLMVEIASTCTSIAPTISVFGDTEQHQGLLTSLGLAGLYGAARLATAGAASARRTLLVTLGAISVACGVALWQLATFDRAQWQNAATYLGWYRPFGSLGHANLLGVMGAGAFSATVGLAASRILGRKSWVAGLLLFGSITVLTLSRAAWLAAAAGSLAVLALGGPWPGRVAVARVATGRRPVGRAAIAGLAVGIVILLALFTLVSPLRARVLELLSVGSGSGRARLEIWKTALAMWLAHPWLGSGPDTFRLLFDRYQTATYWLVEWGAAPFHAHSIYLDTLAMRGIAGVLAAGAVSGAAIISLRAGRRSDAAGRDLVPALVGLLVALGVAGGSGALSIAGAALVACTLGTLPSLATPRQLNRARSVTTHTPSPAPLLSGGLAALLVLLPTAAQLRGSQAAFQSGQQAQAWRAIALARRAEELVPWSDVMASNAAEVLRRRASATPDPDGTLALAEGYARRAIRLAPQRLYNQSELALLLLLRGAGRANDRDREAAAAIARCMALGPYNIMPLIHYSQMASRLGRGDLALPIAQRAVALYPQEALARAALGEAYLALGDTVAARAAMRRR